MEKSVLYIYFDFLDKNKLSILSIIIDTVDKIWYIIVKEVLMDNEGTKEKVPLPRLILKEAEG